MRFIITIVCIALGFTAMAQSKLTEYKLTGYSISMLPILELQSPRLTAKDLRIFKPAQNNSFVFITIHQVPKTSENLKKYPNVAALHSVLQKNVIKAHAMQSFETGKTDKSTNQGMTLMNTEMRSKDKDPKRAEAAYYFTITIEAKKNYYNIVAMCPREDEQKHKRDFKQVMLSLKEW